MQLPENLRMVNIAADLPHDYTRPGVRWRELASITRIVVHWPGDSGAAGYYQYPDRLRNLTNYHLDKDWGGGMRGFALMYHRVIAPDGTIYLTNPLELILWHAHAPANEQGLAIMVDVARSQTPTVAQASTLHAYLSQLSQHTPAISARPQDVYAHREMPGNATNCPGSVMRLIQDWRKQL